MRVETQVKQSDTLVPADFQHEVSPTKTVERLAKNAAKNPGGPDSRVLVSLAIAATEQMNGEVFGEQTQHFADAMQLARDWSAGENNIDFGKLSEYWLEFGKEAFFLASSLDHPETGPFSNIHDQRIQARYVTGNLMLSILYQDPTHTGIHPTKPPWHAGVGANSLASIITSDAAGVMTKKNNTKDHQQDIYTAVEKALTNW